MNRSSRPAKSEKNKVLKRKFTADDRADVKARMDARIAAKLASASQGSIKKSRLQGSATIRDSKLKPRPKPLEKSSSQGSSSSSRESRLVGRDWFAKLDDEEEDKAVVSSPEDKRETSLLLRPDTTTQRSNTYTSRDTHKLRQSLKLLPMAVSLSPRDAHAPERNRPISPQRHEPIRRPAAPHRSWWPLLWSQPQQLLSSSACPAAAAAAVRFDLRGRLTESRSVRLARNVLYVAILVVAFALAMCIAYILFAPRLVPSQPLPYCSVTRHSYEGNCRPCPIHGTCSDQGGLLNCEKGYYTPPVPVITSGSFFDELPQGLLGICLICLYMPVKAIALLFAMVPGFLRGFLNIEPQVCVPTWETVIWGFILGHARGILLGVISLLALAVYRRSQWAAYKEAVFVQSLLAEVYDVFADSDQDTQDALPIEDLRETVLRRHFPWTRERRTKGHRLWRQVELEMRSDTRIRKQRKMIQGQQRDLLLWVSPLKAKRVATPSKSSELSDASIDRPGVRRPPRFLFFGGEAEVGAW